MKQLIVTLTLLLALILPLQGQQQLSEQQYFDADPYETKGVLALSNGKSVVYGSATGSYIDISVVFDGPSSTPEFLQTGVEDIQLNDPLLYLDRVEAVSAIELEGSVYILGNVTIVNDLTQDEETLPIVFQYGIDGSYLGQVAYSFLVANENLISPVATTIAASHDGGLIIGGFHSHNTEHTDALVFSTPSTLSNTRIDLTRGFQLDTDVYAEETYDILPVTDGGYLLTGCDVVTDNQKNIIAFTIDNGLSLNTDPSSRFVHFTDTDDNYQDAVLTESGRLVVIGTSRAPENTFPTTFGPYNVSSAIQPNWLWSAPVSDLRGGFGQPTTDPVFHPALLFEIPVVLSVGCDDEEVYLLKQIYPGPNTTLGYTPYNLESIHAHTGDIQILANDDPGNFGTEAELANFVDASYSPVSNNLLLGTYYFVGQDMGLIVTDPGNCTDLSCDDFIPITCSLPVFGSTANSNNNYSNHVVGNTCSVSVPMPGADITYTYIHEAEGGELTFDLFPIDGNVDLIIYYSDCPLGNSGEICGRRRFNPDAINESIHLEEAPAGTYYVVVDSEIVGAEINFYLSVNCGELNCDVPTINCQQTINDETLDPYEEGDPSQVSYYTSSTGSVARGCNGPEKVYRFVNPVERQVSISLSYNNANSLTDLELIVLTECNPDSLLYSSTKMAGVPEQIQELFPVGTYYIVVEGWRASFAAFQLSVSGCCDPTFYSVEEGECESAILSYTGTTAGDLDYDVVVNNPGPLLTTVPLLLDREPVQAIYNSGTISTYSFSFPQQGTYELCRPEIDGSEEEGCGYVYCCEVVCVEPRPQNLYGLINCKDCGCSEGDANLPAPFACDDFDEAEIGVNSLFGSSDWTGEATHTILEGEGGNYLRFDEAEFGAVDSLVFGLRTNLGTSTPLPPLNGRYRVSADMRVIGQANYSFASRVGESGGLLFSVELVNRLGDETVNRGRISANNGSQDLFFTFFGDSTFLVAHVIDLESNGRQTMHTFIDGQYLGEVVNSGTSNYFSSVTFHQGDNTSFIIDELCVRTRDHNFEESCPQSEENTCLPFGEEYDSQCQAAALGLFADFETSSCLNICDYGGPQIFRSDGAGPLTRELTPQDQAPNGLYSDDCVIELFDGEVPAVLYADIYTFHNDEQTQLDIAGLPEGFQSIIFTCVCDENGCEQVCISEQDFEPGGIYYIVILGATPGTYGFEITPQAEGCVIAASDVRTCQNPEDAPLIIEDDFTDETNDFTNQSEFGYESCYQGFRSYDLPDKVYRLDLQFPAIVNFELIISDGIAGLFIFKNSCSRECISYTDTRVFMSTALLDSVRMDAGSYYLIVDQEEAVSTFQLTIDCTLDETNVDNGIAVSKCTRRGKLLYGYKFRTLPLSRSICSQRYNRLLRCIH